MSEKLEGKNVLITGGAGMLGSTIAVQAVNEGAKVCIVDSMVPGLGGNMFNLKPIENQIEFVRGDVRNPELIRKVVKNKDVIFSLAAQVSYTDSQNDPLGDLDVNCRGHLNLLEACRECNREVLIIFSSSRFVYGSIESLPVSENHPFNCRSIYGIHKLAAEKYYELYYKAYGIRSVSFRIPNPYGPRQQMMHGKYGIVNWFVRRAMENYPLTVYGDGEQRRDYIYVEDFARAMLRSVSCTDMVGEVFNIGSGVGTPFVDMVRIVAETVGNTEVEFVPWPKARYFVETGDYLTDLTKLERYLEWKPEISLREGIELTYEYYRENKKHYWKDPDKIDDPRQ